MDSMMMALLIFWTGIFILFFRRKRKENRKYTTETSDRIEKMHYINAQIHACEELLTEIDLCDEHHHKNVSLTWTTETDLVKKADIWVDGSSRTTEQLRELTLDKMEELASSLFAEMDKLPIRRHNNVIISTLYKWWGSV